MNESTEKTSFSQRKMASYDGNRSDSESSGEISGFDEDDLERRSIGSDISVNSAEVSEASSPEMSPVSSDQSDTEAEIREIEREEARLQRELRESESARNEGWSSVLRAPEVAAFTQVIGPAFQLEEDKRELDFFHNFFPIALVEAIVLETNRYAAKCIQEKPDKLWVDTTFDEMMAFLGMHILFSVIGIPTYSLAWKSTWPFEIPAIPQIMTRTRFERITKYFHVNDTSQNPPRRQPGHDKLCHIRPVLAAVNDACLNNYRPHREQSVDEGMIAFKGRLSFKQYLPAKPTKFGIKVWERADPHNGYVHEFQIYTGKSDTAGAREEGLGTRVVKDLTRKIIGKKHVVYMDNFFSSPKLYEDLEKDQIYCTGTVRANRQGMPAAVKNKKLKQRGDSLTLQKGNMSAIAWKDKKPVYYLSTFEDPTKSSIVKRRQKDGTQKEYPAPKVAENYNKYMFGVDLADQKRMAYSTCRKAKKWWKYLFWFCFDVALVNSFICFQESPNHKKKTSRGREVKRRQIDFRQALVTQMVGTFRGSRKRTAPSTIDNCGNAHWPTLFEKIGRCKQCSKEKRRHEQSVGCKQCGIRLCLKHNCFTKYHKDLLK